MNAFCLSVFNPLGLEDFYQDDTSTLESIDIEPIPSPVAEDDSAVLVSEKEETGTSTVKSKNDVEHFIEGIEKVEADIGRSMTSLFKAAFGTREVFEKSKTKKWRSNASKKRGLTVDDANVDMASEDEADTIATSPPKKIAAIERVE